MFGVLWDQSQVQEPNSGSNSSMRSPSQSGHSCSHIGMCRVLIRLMTACRWYTSLFRKSMLSVRSSGSELAGIALSRSVPVVWVHGHLGQRFSCLAGDWSMVVPVSFDEFVFTRV